MHIPDESILPPLRKEYICPLYRMGGWIMLAIVVGGIVFQIHILVSGRNVMYLQFRRRDLRYEMRSRRDKNIMSKWAAEIRVD